MAHPRPRPAAAGLDQLRAALLDGPPTGLAALLAIEVVELTQGRVVLSLTPDASMLNPLGTVHGGVAATLLDSVAGCAVHSMLAAGAAYTTSQLNIHLVRAVRPDGSRLLGVGEVLHVGRRVATAVGRLTDEEGRLVAHGSVTCMLSPASA